MIALIAATWLQITAVEAPPEPYCTTVRQILCIPTTGPGATTGPGDGCEVVDFEECYPSGGACAGLHRLEITEFERDENWTDTCLGMGPCLPAAKEVRKFHVCAEMAD